MKNKIPIIIPILFTPKTIAKLHLKLTRIQEALKQENITPLEILLRVSPALGNFYARAFTQKETPLKRFDALLGSLFSKNEEGYHTTQTSSDIYKTRGIALNQAKNPHPEYTPKGALKELQNLKQQLTPQHLKLVRDALTKGNLEPYLALLHKDLRRKALSQRKKISKGNLLHAMRFAAFQKLSLKGLNPTDKDLQAILKASPGIQSLDLSHCTQLSPKALLWIQDSCPQIESLNLTGWTQLTRVDAANLARGKIKRKVRKPQALVFPKLEKLILDKSSLTNLYITAPLKILSLKQVENFTTFALSTQQLQKLYLDQCHLPKEVIQEWVQDQPQLEEVSLEGCSQVDARIQKCGVLLQFPSSHKIHTLIDELLGKEEVNLRSNKIDDELAIALARVLPSTKIYTLKLSFNQIGDKGAEALARVLPSTKIHTLDLTYNQIGEKGAEALARVLPNTKIHTLDLGGGLFSNNQIGDKGAEALARVLPITKIHTLDLTYNQIGKKGAEALARVLPSTKIHTLYVSHNMIGGKGAEALARVLPSTKIHTLDVSNNQIGEKGAEALARVLPNTQIHTLKLSYNHIGEKGAEALARVLPKTKIHTIDVSDNQIGDKGAEALARVLPSTKIHTLSLWNNEIGDLGAEALARVLPSTKIHTLQLSSNEIGDLGAEALAPVLPSTKIHTLEVSSNKIGEKGAEALARVLPSTKIHTLDLSINQIGEKGAESLARVLPSTKIHTLQLSYNHIGEKGAEALARVLPSTKIHTLYLYSNHIGDTFLKKIQSLLKPKPAESKQPPKPEADREKPLKFTKQTPIKQSSNLNTVVKPHLKLAPLVEATRFLLQQYFPMDQLYKCDTQTQREVAHIEAQLIEYETSTPRDKAELQQTTGYLQAMLDHLIERGALKKHKDTSWAMLALRLRPPNGAGFNEELVSYMNSWAFAGQNAARYFDPLAVREIHLRHNWNIPLQTAPRPRPSSHKKTKNTSSTPTTYTAERDMYIGKNINIYNDKRVIYKIRCKKRTIKRENIPAAGGKNKPKHPKSKEQFNK